MAKQLVSLCMSATPILPVMFQMAVVIDLLCAVLSSPQRIHRTRSEHVVVGLEQSATAPTVETLTHASVGIAANLTERVSTRPTITVVSASLATIGLIHQTAERCAQPSTLVNDTMAGVTRTLLASTLHPANGRACANVATLETVLAVRESMSARSTMAAVTRTRTAHSLLTLISALASLDMLAMATRVMKLTSVKSKMVGVSATLATRETTLYARKQDQALVAAGAKMVGAEMASTYVRSALLAAVAPS
eukprot:GILJ01001609.1.p2 GENE.GILJ01001609.1~~GILJ01001609.1.p2  ORF type:complete len:250 (+),score=9.41 GILJ01001609.1:424-1173(+)